MSRRGGGGNPISLFSFQDIITSVTGIMILVTLMMTLELVQRSANSPALKTQEIVEEVKPATQDVRRRIDDLKRRLEQQSALVSVAAGLNPKNVRERLKDAQRRTDALREEVSKLEAEERDAMRRREASTKTGIGDLAEKKRIQLTRLRAHIASLRADVAAGREPDKQ